MPHERHRNDGSSFQIGVSRGLRIASNGMLARVLHRQQFVTPKRATASAPRTRQRWTACRAAYETRCQTLPYQGRSHIHAVHAQRAAATTEVARIGPLCPWWTRAGYLLEVGTAIADQFAKPPFRGFALLTLGLAPRPATYFRRVKADQANIWSTVTQADGIAVDDIDGNEYSSGEHRFCWLKPVL